ncbi:MAG: zinc ABC transporter substrate-binding protein [Candidatus Brockarchaeota archaeon]|nr:zinc ABC transporter substrate-binding protein [Candidatus Brockarchaeota archaeon]
MKKVLRSKAALLGSILTCMLAMGFCVASTEAEGPADKPIIVCTTNVLGSIVEEFLQGGAEVVVLVRPSLCPADYDMKPSDIYAVYHSMPGEFWLQGLIEAAGNENLTLVKVPGDYNTPEGAKRCLRLVGGNLSRALSIDLEGKANEMLADIDAAANEMSGEAQALGVVGTKVICMKWLEPFVKWLGFEVVATFNPPETLSAADVAALVETAQREGVALVIDNLQISVEFGSGIASQAGAEHVVMTNFPGAVPGTENLAQMFRYNARQLFEGLRSWRSARALRAEIRNLEDQLALYQMAASVAAIAAIAEAAWILVERKRQ